MPLEGLTHGELLRRPVKGSRVPGRLRAGLAGGVACGLFEAPGLTAPRGKLRPGIGRFGALHVQVELACFSQEIPSSY